MDITGKTILMEVLTSPQLGPAGDVRVAIELR
jgi:hypothetical protein